MKIFAPVPEKPAMANPLVNTSPPVCAGDGTAVIII